MNFEQFALEPAIMDGIRSAGYTIPTPIQIKAIPEILKGADILGLAQTGTGKTAAFMLPILHRLASAPSHRPKVLVLAPTRELAEQIHNATQDLAKHTRLRSVALYGGVSKNQQINA
ncbi:MAG: DEAD/DEAH box helicase, partial [Spirochaetales bacterium]